MLRAQLLVFLLSLLIRDIIWTSLFTPNCDIASSQARDFTIDLDELQSTLKAEISVAQQRYQKSTDVQRSPAPDFKVGDKVFVKA